MKKIYVLVLAAILVSLNSFAQKGKNEIGAGVDLSLPAGDFGDGFKVGAGVYVKGLYGVGEAGQVTFTTGYSGFKAKGSTSDFKMTLGAIPFIVGYRHHFGNLFAEPQIGYGNYKMKIKGEDDYYEFGGSDSNGAFTWALGGGYIFNEKIEAGLRYQSAARDNSNLGAFVIRVGYKFSLPKK